MNVLPCSRQFSGVFSIHSCCQFAAFLLLGLLIGCGGGSGRKSAPMVELKGKVNLDQLPLAEGEIKFVAPGQNPAVLKITKGEFAGRVELEPGEKKVEIYAYKPANIKLPDPSMPTPVENYIPDRFNIKTELKTEIKKSGPNELTFNVDSK